MKEIGGFFGLEINKKNFNYHSRAIPLSYGRSSLNLLIKLLNIKKIFIPFYCCNSVISVLEENNIEYVFYSINYKLEIENEIILKDYEFILYINYFSLKKDYINQISNFYRNKLIVDNTQDFFSKGYKYSFSFNSARKFFGVPDGSYLYFPNKLLNELSLIKCNNKYKELNYIIISYLNYKININKRNSPKLDYLIDKISDNKNKAYIKYLKKEEKIKNDINLISKISEILLANVNLKKVKNARINNYNIYNKYFKDINLLKLLKNENEIPFFYPLLLDKKIDLKKFYSKNIFIPVFWKDVLERNLYKDSFNFEKNLSDKLLLLPLDHRYNFDDINIVVNNILEEIL
ncbi:MAG: hypothetical protein U0457_14590 [Candidatus Sericytochromatia bacterium]